MIHHFARISLIHTCAARHNLHTDLILTCGAYKEGVERRTCYPNREEVPTSCSASSLRVRSCLRIMTKSPTARSE